MTDELPGLELPRPEPEAKESIQQRITEREMLGLLREKYTRVRPGTNADRFVRAQHVRYPAERYVGEARAIADYLVVDTYDKHELIGFEVKVSRADWLAELRNPRKAEYWRQHCHRWYLVSSDPNIVRDDLPDGWGHITLGPRGLRITRRAPALAAEPMTGAVLAYWGRAIAKTRASELEADAIEHFLERTSRSSPERCSASTPAAAHSQFHPDDPSSIRCTRLGAHDEHEDAYSGLTWMEP
ncbi:hypothetical protein MUN78_07045 [Leucobacter allii]|uniref:MmcB family DNA repair protein n=1 Tax=Leucobacter allii TaxID=2932247 RepID=A0ABY4FQM9_9MICO|nr:hypothetical protein [Leucobacter allii]UOQ58573.1 hypothetical protein MUN78_07045 [Leucobacter allii]